MQISTPLLYVVYIYIIYRMDLYTRNTIPLYIAVIYAI